MWVSRSRLGEASAVVATAVLLLVGCNSKRLTSLEVRAARLEEQVAALERTQARLTGLTDSLSALVEQQTRELRERRATSEQRLSELERTVQALQAELQETRNAIGDLKDRLRFEAAPSGGARSGGTGGGTPAPRVLYDAAYQDLTRGNREIALAGFQELLAKYPTSELADNSRYWIGEAHYSQTDYDRALEEFRKVPADYPTGDKVPDALLKIGYCLQNLGRDEEARAAFRELIDRFPGSEEARLAKNKLSEL